MFMININNMVFKKVDNSIKNFGGGRGFVAIDYFNIRKMAFEPFLEKWTFAIIARKDKHKSDIILKNFES